MELNDKITKIKGIGEKSEKIFAKLGIFTVQDLIEYYPRGYEVYGPMTSIGDISEGSTVVIEGSIASTVQIKRVSNLQIINVRVKDGSGSIGLVWFNMPFLRNKLKMGTKYIFRGKVIVKNGFLVMQQPQILTKEEYYNRMNILQPIYSLTSGITNHGILKAVGFALKELDFQSDYLPVEIRKRNDLMDYKGSIKAIHFPKDHTTMEQARRRIVFDEFFLFTLALNQIKREKVLKKSNFPMIPSKECDQLIQSLQYELTGAQNKVWNEIKQDLESNIVMNRLIQGDVGSGKTILAALALLMTAQNGYQGTLMVPTEVLAKQHFESLQELFSPYGIRISLLVGSMTAKEKRVVYEEIKTHQTDIIVGTHALIQEQVEYSDLALVITDEQHRFGVKQREALSMKGTEPHMMVMSATPIPRTLAIILYGDLDLSVIDELPTNRLPIKNCVVNTGYRTTAYGFIAKEVQSGRQAYVICPMVAESEAMEAENVIEYTEKIKEELPGSVTVEYLHGKMKAKEKNEIMERFSKGEIQVLVSTTVVEVGVNVPNATVMMIENAERFGLAQLHQLRGRVGRGKHQSYCIMVSGNQGKDTKKRLEILNQSNDGFFIANEDLKLRGPGDLFGIQQSGMLEFAMGDVFQDSEILKQANEEAKIFSKEDINLLCKKYENLKNKIGTYTESLFL